MCPSTVATEVFLPSNFRYLMICQVVINVGSTYSNCSLKVAVNVSLSWSISMISITSVDMHGPLQVQQLYGINGKSPRWKSRQMWQIREKERERESEGERERECLIMVSPTNSAHRFWPCLYSQLICFSMQRIALSPEHLLSLWLPWLLVPLVSSGRTSGSRVHCSCATLYWTPAIGACSTKDPLTPVQGPSCHLLPNTIAENAS